MPKPAAIEHTRALLASLEGQRVVDASHPAFSKLVDVVDRHPRSEEKIGPGIRAFIVYRGFGHHIALDILRTDGSRIDISWRKCVSRRDYTARAKLRRAMRDAVGWQVQGARDYWRSKGDPCALCGGAIGEEPAHVDHVTPFETLATRFLAGREEHAPKSFTENPDTHMTAFCDADATWAGDWQSFHAEHGELRLVHAQCNLRRAKEAQGG